MAVYIKVCCPTCHRADVSKHGKVLKASNATCAVMRIVQQKLSCWITATQVVNQDELHVQFSVDSIITVNVYNRKNNLVVNLA